MDLNHQQLRLRLFHVPVLLEQNSLLKYFIQIGFYTSAARNAFHKLPNIHFCEHFLQISQGRNLVGDTGDVSPPLFQTGRI